MTIYSEFSHYKWTFSTAILNYQTVIKKSRQRPNGSNGSNGICECGKKQCIACSGFATSVKTSMYQNYESQGENMPNLCLRTGLQKDWCLSLPHQWRSSTRTFQGLINHQLIPPAKHWLKSKDRKKNIYIYMHIYIYIPYIYIYIYLYVNTYFFYIFYILYI